MKYISQVFMVLFIVGNISIAGSCKKEINTPATVSCDFNNLIQSSANSYDFEGVLSNYFIQTNRWESAEASLIQTTGQIELSALGSNISEVWLTHSEQMQYGKSWNFSVIVSVPIAWNSASGNEPQVGIGIFAGKPEASGQSKKVYECNLAVVGNGERFVQGQVVANRLGGDPIKVDHKVLSNNLETAELKLQYCATGHTLTLLIDGEIIGTQAIDASGPDNWTLSNGDLIDIGIMGFAENTSITSNFPSIDDFQLKVYE